VRDSPAICRAVILAGIRRLKNNQNQRPQMKKIDLKKLRSLAIGTLVVSPALITVAYADGCTDDFVNCQGNASYNQGQCQNACTYSPDPEACNGACDTQYNAAVERCWEEWMECGC
jgi:hypothetical protein